MTSRAVVVGHLRSSPVRGHAVQKQDSGDSGIISVSVAKVALVALQLRSIVDSFTALCRRARGGARVTGPTTKV